MECSVIEGQKVSDKIKYRISRLTNGTGRSLNPRAPETLERTLMISEINNCVAVITTQYANSCGAATTWVV